jgi:4-diphosphocytidyl-2-C-methyl-D-erythritol kinase
LPAKASAKINLFLHVGNKRPDGFHALESLVAFTRAGDELACSAGDALSLIIDGPFAAGLSGEGDNLVLRAARKLAARKGIEPCAQLVLTKNLPVASGIGGGSADAAAALRELNRLWNCGFTPSVLREIAAEIGSDIPVCVESVPAWMEGRGERVEALARFPELPIVLVNPGISVPTGPVFAALETRRGTTGLRPDQALSDMDAVLRFLKPTSNDLEAPALKIAPVVGEVLDALKSQPGAVLTRMSGSGATCFSLFRDARAADAAAGALVAAHPHWWVKSTVLSGTV